MSTFFVNPDAITPSTIRITGDLLHHLRDSLRLRPGDSLVLNDGCGTRYRVEVTHLTSQAIDSRIIDRQTEPTHKTSPIVLGQSLIKGDKMDWVIQKATELGVDRVVPIHAIHSVVKLRTDRADHQLARWQRIALEAAQQSECWSVPHIDDPATFSQLVTGRDTFSSKIILAERSKGTSLQTIPLPIGLHDTMLLLIGPEGGWSLEELSLARDQGYTAVTLGTRILRAETAAIAAISILQARIGELG